MGELEQATPHREDRDVLMGGLEQSWITSQFFLRSAAVLVRHRTLPGAGRLHARKDPGDGQQGNRLRRRPNIFDRYSLRGKNHSAFINIPRV